MTKDDSIPVLCYLASLLMFILLYFIYSYGAYWDEYLKWAITSTIRQLAY